MSRGMEGFLTDQCSTVKVSPRPNTRISFLNSPMRSPAVEDYLKAIYKQGGDDPASTTAIAESLGVSSASVTNMVKRLAEMQLVEYQSYRGVTLTEAGEKIALEIIRHHRLLETYLREVMGYSWEQMHEEAEQLEHHISEEFESKLDELLGYPTHDPHGHPIPSRDGEIIETDAFPLTEADEEQALRVSYLLDTDAEMLQYLEDRGILPDAEISIVNKEPFNGPISVLLGGNEYILGYEVATHVFVAHLDEPE